MWRHLNYGIRLTLILSHCRFKCNIWQSISSLHTTHLNIFKILFVCVCVCMCEYVCLFTEKVQGVGMLIAAGALEMDFIKSVLSRPSLSKEPCGRCKQNESSIKHSQQEHEVRSALPKLCWFKRLCLTRARRGGSPQSESSHPEGLQHDDIEAIYKTKC